MNQSQFFLARTQAPAEPPAGANSRLCLWSEQAFEAQSAVVIDLLQSVDADIYYAARPNQTTAGGYWYLQADYAALESLSNNALRQSSFDYFLWPEGVQQPPQLLLFDMDSTFIQIEVIDELARRAGVGESVAAVTEAAMRGELDFSQSLVSRVACLQGLQANVINEIADNLPVSPGVPALVKASQRNRCKVAIVSGGFQPFVERLKHDMGLYRVKANQLEIDNQQLTGKVLGNIVDARAKAEFLQALCDESGIEVTQCMAIGDGANDLLMMQAAGFNLAYRAKPKVQAEAKGRIQSTDLGWLVAAFEWA